MQNQKRRLTKTLVQSITPREREFVLWDGALPGFGLRVRPTGAKSYIFTYRRPGGRAGKVRRVTITAASPEQARFKAKSLAAQYHGGGDPAEAKAEGGGKAGYRCSVADHRQVMTPRQPRTLQKEFLGRYFEAAKILDKHWLHYDDTLFDCALGAAVTLCERARTDDWDGDGGVAEFVEAWRGAVRPLARSQ